MVTLGRPGRGPVRRDAVGRRHGDRGDRRHPVALESSSGGVEVEDLPSQRVQTRGSGGMGLGGTLAIAGVVVLLAAGFGILGGRRAASAPAAGARTADVATATAAAAFAGEPQVTPDIPCAPPPKTPPGVQLEVGAQRTPGTIELLNWAPVGASASGSEDVPLVDRPERIEIRSDIPVELWIEGGACAVSWTIDVAAFLVIDVLEQVDNPERFPGLASQNRFRLVLAAHQGRTLDLRATLIFPGFTTRASWPIRVLPFTPPTGLLTAGLETVGTVGGCDVRLTLGNGWVSPHEPCSDGVAEDPGMPHQLAPGRRLEFRFDHEDWQIDGAGTVCGSLSGHLFVAEPRCQVGAPDPGRFSFSFAAPRVSGVHVLAISACGTQLLADATNQLCGTWFANLEVRR